jgi:hypothetical protein
MALAVELIAAETFGDARARWKMKGPVDVPRNCLREFFGEPG